MFKPLLQFIFRLLTLAIVLWQVNFPHAIAFAQENVKPPISPVSEKEQLNPADNNPQVIEQSQGDRQTSQTHPVQQSQNRSKVTYPQPPHRYNKQAMEKYNEEVYGN